MVNFNNGGCSVCGAQVPEGMQRKHKNFHDEVEHIDRRLGQLERKVAERS